MSISFAQAITRCLDSVFYIIGYQFYTPETFALLQRTELEIRFGSITEKTKPPSTKGTFCEYVYAAGEHTPFNTSMDRKLFYASAQQILTTWRQICHTITPMTKSTVVPLSEPMHRYVLDGSLEDGKIATMMKKVPLLSNMDFFTTLGEKNPRNWITIDGVDGIRVSLAEEIYLGEAKMSSTAAHRAARVRARRSVYFFDTTASAAAENRTQWPQSFTLPTGLQTTPPKNPWRVDFTRVNGGDDNQIEMELDFVFAWQLYNREFENVCPKEQQTLQYRQTYIKYRIMATLGQALYYLQTAMFPEDTPPTWCRQLA